MKLNFNKFSELNEIVKFLKDKNCQHSHKKKNSPNALYLFFKNQIFSLKIPMNNNKNEQTNNQNQFQA